MPLHTAIVIPRARAQVPQSTLVVPLTDGRSPLRLLADARSLAARMISEVTGTPVSDQDVEVLIAHPGRIWVPTVSAPVEVCHPKDGHWYRGNRTAWVNQLGRSWRPVVRYTVGSVQWERILAAGWWHPLRSEDESPPSAAVHCLPHRKNAVGHHPAMSMSTPRWSG